MPAKPTIREALRGIGKSSLISAHGRVERDAAYLESIREEYTAQYPNQWIAVYNKEVIGPIASPGDLLGTLREQGIDPGLTVLAFLDPEFKRTLLL